MFCPKCGKQLSDGAKFCTGCGTQIGPVSGNGQKREAKKLRSEKTPKQPKQAESNVAGMRPSGLSAQVEMSQKTKETENKNKRIMIILFVVLIVLIMVAVGMAVYYFKSLNSSGNSNGNSRDIQSESDAGDRGQMEDQDANENAEGESNDGSEGGSESEDGTETDTEGLEPEDAAVVSDTNEVVKNTVLPNIPKALYSYEFEDTLGNAQVVVREVPQTMPEVTTDITPQYVNGMDGKAVYLDGTYGIRLNDVEKIGTSYSIAFWMKADAFYDWAPFIHIGYDLLDTSRESRLWLGQKTDGVSVAPILSSERAVTSDSFEIRPEEYAVNKMDPGIWYHIVFTVDGNTKGSRDGSLRGTLYVSGRYAGEGDIVLDTMNVNNFDVYLGINCWDILYPVAFDSVKIWDTVLDGQQVGELFDAYQ